SPPFSRSDIDFALVHLRKQRLGTALQARGICIDTGQPSLWKTFGQILFDTLRATPHRLEIKIAASRARTRDRRPAAAMMALQARPIPQTVEHGVSGAVRTLADPPARCATQHRRITAPVYEDQHLLPRGEPSRHRVEQLRRETLLQSETTRIDQPHIG